jgi:hypothetical protein
LKTAENMFQIVVIEHSRRVTIMGNTMEIFFQTLVDEFQDNSDLLEDLEEEVKSLPHTSLGMEVNPVDENKCLVTQRFPTYKPLSMSFMKKLAPLQEDNNRLFDKYQALKEDYDAILLQLTMKDETIQDLQDCKQNLEEEVRQL